MTKLSNKLTGGLTSARSGSRNLKRAMKKEWRALRVAQQDRAHLATIANAPSREAPAGTPPLADGPVDSLVDSRSIKAPTRP